MPSFLDKVRETPPERRWVAVIGYDPDLHIGGYAMVSAEIGGGTRISSAELHLADYEEVAGVGAQRVNAIAKRELPDIRVPGGVKCFAIVEGQRVYANIDATRAKIVAQANDLIQVAQVAGAVLGKIMFAGIPAIVVEPQVWKGQRKKRPDHEDSIREIGDVKVVLNHPGHSLLVVRSHELAALPRKWEHAMDALGMALYGLDLLSTNRWPS